MPNIPSPGTEKNSSSTGENYYNLIKDAVISEDLARVKAGLYQWQSDPSITIPIQDQLNYLVPQTAEGDKQPAILEYLLSLGGKIDTHSINLATFPDIFKIFISYGWEVNNVLFRSHVQHPQLIALFLTYGANLSSSDPRNFCALDIAALHKPLETVKLLIDHDVVIGSSSVALHVAA